MKFPIADFFSKCDQIRRKLCIWSHLLKKFAMENFIFCAVIRLKFAKNQARAKQHPKAELLLFENYSLSSSMLSSTNNRPRPRHEYEYNKYKLCLRITAV